MTLADQIREISFDIPAREVANRLGCSPDYVRGLRSKIRNPDLERLSKARAYLRDREKILARNEDYRRRNRDKVNARERARRAARKAEQA